MGTAAVHVYASLHYRLFADLHRDLRNAIRNGRWNRASLIADRILNMVNR